jgi:hypothetical protein
LPGYQKTTLDFQVSLASPADQALVEALAITPNRKLPANTRLLAPRFSYRTDGWLSSMANAIVGIKSPVAGEPLWLRL